MTRAGDISRTHSDCEPTATTDWRAPSANSDPARSPLAAACAHQPHERGSLRIGWVTDPNTVASHGEIGFEDATIGAVAVGTRVRRIEDGDAAVDREVEASVEPTGLGHSGNDCD